MLTAVGPGAGQPARADDPPPPRATGPGLDWGIKESWRLYVGATGTKASAGATINPDGTFRFVPKSASYDPDTKTTKASYSGTVNFTAYCEVAPSDPDFCALDSTFSDPEVIIGKETQTLSMVIQSHSKASIPEPGAKPHDFGRIVVADLGVDGATIDSANGQTAWSGITAVLAGGQAPVATSYPEGTMLDKLAFAYLGEGGKPDFGETFDPPGTPTFDNVAASFFEPRGNGALLYPYLSKDGNTLFVVDSVAGRGGQYPRLRALNPKTLEPLPGGEFSAVTQPGGRTHLTSVEFDVQSNTFFYVEQPAGAQSRTLLAAQWRDDQFVVTTLATIPGTTVGERLAWIPASGQLAVLDSGGKNEGTVMLFRPSDAGWQFRQLALPDPATLSYLPAGTTSIYYGDVTALAALDDGSLIMTSSMVDGLSASRFILPADDSQQVIAKEVPGSTLTTGAGELRAFDRIRPMADGMALTYTFFSGGTTQRYRLSSGELEATERLDAGSLGVKNLDGMISDPEQPDRVYLLDGRSRTLLTVADSAVISRHDVPDSYETTYGGTTGMAVGADGAIFVQLKKGSTWGIQRIERTGFVPSFSLHPKSQTLTLNGEVARTLTLEVAAQGEPAPGLQWQSRQPGGKFADIPGATTARLTVRASYNTDGTEYRVIARSAVGVVASETATLTVHSAPVIETPPADQTVSTRQTATFNVQVEGSAPVEVSWQQRLRGGNTSWSEVTAGGKFVVDGRQLSIVNPGIDLNGAEFRAVAANDYGTTTSSAARLRVESDDPNPPGPTTYKGVVFEWAGAAEWQAQPPNGSAANYFSVGESDGTPNTYSAERGGFSVIQRAANGARSTASWGARGAHVIGGGTQLIRLANGEGTVKPDGSATITWPGAFSVNFYDGLVPFTIKNPRLQVNADGSGTLRGDLSGYAGDIANPDKPKEKAPSATGVVIAQFRGVSVDTKKGFVVKPAYQGVRITAPPGATRQVTSGDRWGAWPQSFVDFQGGTGLAAYFYSTGGAMDPAKPPADIAVGFDQAIPEVEKPVTEPPGDGGGPPPSTPIPPTIETPGGGGGGTAGRGATIVGELAWGVKSSFQSYITGPIAKGRVELSGGADYRQGAYRFGQQSTTWTASSGTGSTGYRGAVRFYGHGGILDLTLSDPQVSIDSASRGTLLVRVNGGAPVAFGTLDLGAAAKRSLDGGVSYTGVPVTLTADGAKVFSYGSSVFYQAGTPMDPLSFVIGAPAPAGSGPGGRTLGAGDLANGRNGAPNAKDAAALALPPAAAAAAGCRVTDATMRWGFKESFRSYISGSIAHGRWSTSDGAAYATPKFQWGKGTGTFDGATWTGEIGLGGTIRFTGHDGLLDTTVANPRIRFVDNKTAFLIVDVAGLTMEDALAGKKDPVIAKGIPFARLDLAAGKVEVNPEGTIVTAGAVPATITNEGFAAFPNYPAGTAFDPVDFTLTTDPTTCTQVAAVAPPDAAAPPAEATLDGGGLGAAGIPWPWLALGGAGVLVAGAAAGAGAALLLVKHKLAALGLSSVAAAGPPPPGAGAEGSSPQLGRS